MYINEFKEWAEKRKFILVAADDEVYATSVGETRTGNMIYVFVSGLGLVMTLLCDGKGVIIAATNDINVSYADPIDYVGRS